MLVLKMATPNQRDEDHWTFDKRIPVALIGTLVVQLAMGVWWVSALNSRVSELERGADKVLIRSASNDTDMGTVKERVLKLEINLTNINTKLDEIKDLIRKK